MFSIYNPLVTKAIIPGSGTGSSGLSGVGEMPHSDETEYEQTLACGPEPFSNSSRIREEAKDKINAYFQLTVNSIKNSAKIGPSKQFRKWIKLYEPNYAKFRDILKNPANLTSNSDGQPKIYIESDTFNEIYNFIHRDPPLDITNLLNEDEKKKLNRCREHTFLIKVVLRISKLIDENKIKFPFRTPSMKEVNELFGKLKDLSQEPLTKVMRSEKDEVNLRNHKYGEFCPNNSVNNNLFGCKIIRLAKFMKISEAFSGSTRLSSGNHFRGDVVGVWSEPDYRLRPLKTLFNKRQCHSRSKFLVDNALIKRAFLRVLSVFSDFNPTAVTAIITLLKEKFALTTEEGIHMLDTSAGWGGRLVGALADTRVVSYTGFDPNTNLYDSYQKITNEFSSQSKTAVRIFCKPSETLTISDIEKSVDETSGFSTQFDLLLTSPPYWDTEKYSNESTQSWKQYPKLNDWEIDYLFQTLYKATSFLKVGGFVVINIADVWKRGKEIKICEPMIKFLRDFLRMEYLGAVAYPVGINCEPVWLFKKSDSIKRRFDRDDLLDLVNPQYQPIKKRGLKRKREEIEFPPPPKMTITDDWNNSLLRPTEPDAVVKVIFEQSKPQPFLHT